MQQHAPVASNGRVTVVGFPKFWQTAFNLKPAAFEEVRRIGDIQNEIFTKAPKNQLERVLRHLAKNAMNTLGATLTLCLNGYGHDAMKLARNTYEAHLNAAYLEKHPDEIDDYIDFYHVLIKDQLDNLDQSNPALTKELPADRREEAVRNAQVPELMREEAILRRLPIVGAGVEPEERVRTAHLARDLWQQGERCVGGELDLVLAENRRDVGRCLAPGPALDDSEFARMVERDVDRPVAALGEADDPARVGSGDRPVPRIDRLHDVARHERRQALTR